MIITGYQLGWLRSHISVLKSLNKALKKENISIFFKEMIDIKPPVWYEPFLTRNQIKQIDKENAGE